LRIQRGETKSPAERLGTRLISDGGDEQSQLRGLDSLHHGGEELD
jgi:hypothetical protein